MKPNYFARHIRWVLRPVAITLTILATASVHLSARPQNQNISISMKNAALPQIFMSIYQQTGYYFIYKDELLKDAKRVTINVKNATIQEVLTIVFEGQPLTYSISDHVIVVKRKSENGPVPDVPIVIKGRVLNEKGEPLEGADVYLKGSNKGTQTDANGNFLLKVEDKDIDLIIISFTGYQSKSIVGQKGIFFTVILSISESPLDLVQIIGYGTTSKRLNTGSVSSVKKEDIEKQPVSNPLSTLEGRMAGVAIQQNTGLPGGSFNIQIRGQNSLRNGLTDNGNLPLFVIDGVPFISASMTSIYTTAANLQYGSPLSSINPSDIESIDVLKDADATAIYGSRGANGVVLITTKKGKAGKTQVEINGYSGIGQVPHFLKLLNTNAYLTMRHEAKNNDTAPLYSYDYDINGKWDSTRNTDWQKKLIGGTASILSLQGSVSGGNANTQFLIGGGYFRETTVSPGNFADRKASAHLSLNNVSENHRFKTSLSVSYVNDQNNLFPNDLTSMAMTLAPDAPAIYDSSGNLNWQNNTWTNPLSYLKRTYRSITNDLISNILFNYQLLDGLQLRASLGYNNINVQEISTIPIAALNPAFIGHGSALFANSSLRSWIAEPQAEYQHDLFKGTLKLLAGISFQENIRQDQTLQATGFSDDALIANIQAASSLSTVASNYSDYRYNGFFARINYNLRDRYLINLTGRRDGSSRFGPGKQFANFGSAGAAWIFSSEPIFQKIKYLISFGKIRASYGITGSDQIGDYGYLDSYSPTSFPYQVGGLLPTRLANPKYAWEINKKAEAAVELGFFEDRILISVAYYQNHSSNQLVGFPLSEVTGFSSLEANFPAVVRNAGLEIECTSANIKTASFLWTTSFNLSIPRNKLLTFPNIESTPYVNIYKVGQPLSIKSLFQSTGVNPQTGVYTFSDLDKNGSIDYPNDLVYQRKIASNYFGGVSNSFQYKNFSCSIMIQFASQTGYNYFQTFGRAGYRGNQPVKVLERWQKPGDITDIQKFTSSVGDAFFAYSNAFSSDKIISDASFIRIRNVSVSYKFPSTHIQKKNGIGVRLYLQGENLLTITHYLGMDPENQNSSVLPPLRVLTAGVQINL